MTHDLAIVGAGLAGLALARAVRAASTLRVALIAREPAPAMPAAGAPIDARVYAVTPGNAAFLARLGAWQSLPAARMAPVRAMRVFGDAPGAGLEFDAYRAGVGELAWIVEDAALQSALWQGLADVDLIAPAHCEALEIAAGGARLRLRGGREIAARLVVGADGARSFVREQAGIRARTSAYGQSAVVANFACERPHGGAACQWFQGGPVLALLPLPGDSVSMVWSTADAERLLALDAPALCAEVERASGRRYGGLRLLGAPRAYPLQRLSAEHVSAPRIALVGEAAHVVHPLAGQGANLGMQDARALAAVLSGREPQRDPGDARLLRRYARARAADVLAMDATVHGLYRLFAAAAQPVQRLRNAGLNLTGRLPVLGNLLMRQAMT